MRARLWLTAMMSAALLLAACTGSDYEPPTAGGAALMAAADPGARADADVDAGAAARDDARDTESRAVETLRELTVRESVTEADDVWWWLDTPPSPDAALVVTEVHAEQHDGFDRVVLHLAGSGEPGWVTEVVDTPTDDASGFAVEVAGDRFVLLRLAGMAFPPDAEAPAMEPGRVPVGGAVVAEVAVRHWFEGNLDTFLGVVGEAEPRVTVELLRDPLRLAVDVARA